MSCRDHYWEWCRCYKYVCPGPKGDPRGCGATYEHTANAYHWAEPEEPCAQCLEKIPDIGCIPKITQRKNQTIHERYDQRHHNLEQGKLFHAS